jgi:ribosomal protein S14
MAGGKSKKTAPESRIAGRFRGKGIRKCRFCGNARGVIRKYGLYVCRRCFREKGEQLGFRTY